MCPWGHALAWKALTSREVGCLVKFFAATSNNYITSGSLWNNNYMLKSVVYSKDFNDDYMSKF